MRMRQIHTVEHAPDAGRGEQVTAEQTVKAKWPDAHISAPHCERCARNGDTWAVLRTIQPNSKRKIGEGFTEAEAWENAAKRIIKQLSAAELEMYGCEG